MLLLLSELVFFPLLEILFGHDFHGATHLAVSQTAELRAGDLVGSDLVRLEMEWYFHSGNNVLLQAQLAHEEIVDYVPRSKNEPDRLAHGDFERSIDDVVFAG